MAFVVPANYGFISTKSIKKTENQNNPGNQMTWIFSYSGWKGEDVGI
jgi:hypothetical protein